MASRRTAGGFLLATLLALAPSARAEGPLAVVADDGRLYTASADASGAFGGWTQLDDLGAGTLRGVAVDHFDGDGYLDLVTGRVSSTQIVLYKYPGLPGGSFGPRQRLGAFAAAGSHLMDLASGDCNGDGIADLVANTNSTTTAFLMSGPDGFQVRTEALETGTGRGMDLGDVNEDGHLDLVRARQGDGQVSLYLGNGAGAFTFLRFVGDAGSDPYGVAVADFNADGHLDVLANEGGSGNVTLWRGNGAGTFLPGLVPSGADHNNFTAFDAFDFNGDGNVDLVASTYTSQAVHYSPGLGNGNFGAPVRVNPATPSPGNLLAIGVPPYRHPLAPIARVTPAEQTLGAGSPAHLDGSASTAAAGSVLAEQGWSFGDGTTGTGAVADHTYTAKGRYWPRHRVRADNGLADLAKVLAIVTGPPPTAHAGGPYIFTEAQAVGEIWTGQLDGRATLDDGGEGATYLWNLMPDIAFSDEFTGTLDPSAWLSAGSHAAGGALRVASTSLGDWGASYAASVANFPRRRGLTFYTRMVSRSSENTMFGIKNTTTNHHYNQLQHAFYVAGTNLYIYEAGANRGFFRNIAYNTWYDLKIELQAIGAQYWYRPSGSGEPWELVYTSTHNSGPEVKVGFSGYTQGRNEFDYVYLGRRAEGPLVTETFGGPGTFPISLTVTDFLGQSSTAATTVTTTGDLPPAARTGGPYLFGEGSALNGQYVAVLDGRTSSDDHGIARYDWDFGDGTTGTGAQPSHTYAGRGPYTIRLTVRDHAGQTHSDQGVVSFGAGNLPVAGIQGPATVDESAANAGSWSATFLGGTSSDDFGIWRYQWNFGNGRTATTATATTQYTATGTYTVTLTVFDHAGQSHSTSHSLQVQANALPAARIAGPSLVDESAAQHGLFTAAFNAAPSTDDYGIWRYQWNFGDGGTATVANPTHQFAGPGAFTVRLTVFDHAGQSHSADHPITLAANEPPVARIAASPTTVEGAREIAFSGLASSDDFGISDWAWDFGERMFPFTGTVLSPVDWQAGPGVIQDGRVILTGTGTFGARHVQSTRTYQRESELRARVRVPAGTHQGVIGFKALNETAVQADFEHAVYFNNGRWVTIENGGAGSHTTYAANAEYEIRIVTKAAGADFYVRPLANPDWTLLRSTTALTDYPLEIAWSVISGTFEFDDVAVRARAHGPEVSAVFGASGEARLTVTDHARQTHTAAQAITVVQGAPPLAVIQGPESYGVGLEANFSGLGSSDDHGIARYEWDFGDGTTGSGDRVGHVYATAGVYTLRLTVFDFAGQTGIVARAVNITGQNMVRCVPWRFNNGIEVPHETWTGKLVTLKGVASTAPRPFTYTWDFGDGSPVATGTVTTEEQSYEIQAQHAYSGPHGTPYVATLSIVDAAGVRSTDTYPLILKDRTLTVETNVAIDEALWYLHKSQVRTVSGGLALSNWSSYSGYRTNVSASAIQAFEINGHQPQGDQAQDPYVETVRRGLDYLLTQVSYNNIGSQTHGNPDANGNGIGLGGTENDQPYQMGAVMDAIIASGSPTFLSRTGGTNVRGRRYLDLVQDMADMYAWGQEETGGGRGGWRYSWHGGSDNSAAQWGAIGLIPAERLWGVTVPAFVKAENQVWLNASYQGGTGTCGFGYTGPGHTLEQTSSGMVQLAFQRAARNSTQWACTEARMDNLWTSFIAANTTYGYYAFTKAMRLAPSPVVNLSVSGRDWFDAEPNGLRRTLVGRQRADGSWLSNHGLPSEPVINTAWTTIILTPTLFESPPVAIIHASPNPGAVGQAVRFDGSQSYHVDPFRRVTSYAWDFDASDGVDWDTPDAEGPIAGHAFGALRSYTVSLRVGDDQDPPNFDVATARIDITTPPHPPTAVPGGPYVAAAGEAVALDGSGSFDIDAAQGDAVTAWGWETDFQNPRDFDDALGARPAGVTFPSAGTYNVGLRVTDNTAVTFPQSGSPNLNHEAYTTVQVHNRCLESLAARGKATMVALTWTHDGSAAYAVRRSTVSPSYGFEDIGTTSSTYSTFIDYNVEIGRTYYYRVQSANGCASHAVSIVPRFRSTNRRPVFTSAPVTAAQEAQAYAYDANAADPEGQTLTWFLDQGPAGMTVNAATGMLAWIPTRAQVGSHPVSIRAVDPGDMAAVQAFQIMVAPRPNLPPVPAITAPAQALSGQPILFDGSGSTDPENDIPLSHAWNFGDGTVASGPSASHAFGAAGTLVVTLFVTDSRGATGAATHTVVVNEPNRVPVARPGGPYTVSAGEPLALDGSASSDPDGDPLTFLWHFGDDTDPVAGAVASHTYAAEGTYQATLEVSDGRGGNGGATVPVVVTAPNHSPVARIVADRTFANPGEEFAFDATTSTDADGDVLVHSWAFGDGSQTTGDQVTHVYGAPGHYIVALTADDQRGRQGSATLGIHVNAPPVFAEIGNRSTAEDAPLVLPLSAPDADGHAVTFSLLAGPAGLTLQNGPGSLFWQPDNHDVGPHTVRLRAEDGLGGSDETAFILTVSNVNDAPVITSTSVTTVEELTGYLYGVTASDVDAGDAVTFSLVLAPAGMTLDPLSGLISWIPTHTQVGDHPVTVRATDGAGAGDDQTFILTVMERPWAPAFTSSPPAAATEDQAFQYQATAQDLNAADVLVFSLVAGPTGMGVDPATGLVSWTPLNEHVGTQVVRLRVSDGTLFADQEFSLAVANTNDAPVITSAAPGVAVVGEALTYAIEASDPDAGDLLNFALAQGAGTAVLDPATGLLTWTPVEAELGEQDFRVVVQDAAGAFAAQDFTVRVQRTPEPPVFTSMAPTAATQGQLYEYQAAASDPNDDPLAFALVTGPAGLTVTSAGLVSFTPGSQQTGNQPVRLSVTDSRFTVEQAFTLVVANVNDAPLITSTPPPTGTDGVTYTYQVTATDADGDPLAYGLEASPAGMSISAAGLVTWPDDGARPDEADVVVRVGDGQGGSATQSWAIRIVADNLPPSVSIQFSANPVAPGQFVTISVGADDNVGVASRSLIIDGNAVAFSGNQYQFQTGGAGDLLIEASATDLNGNTASASRTLQVSDEADAQAPQVTLTFGPANPSAGDRVTFDVGTTDETGIDPERVWLLVDGQYLPVTDGRAEFVASMRGSFTALATAYDLAGNYGEARATLNVTMAGSDAVPPTAGISGPVDEIEVLGTTDITGTAADANFAYYTLGYAKAGHSDFVEYARSYQAVTDGKLGVIDGTNLGNGEYVIRLTAYDKFGNSNASQLMVRVSGGQKLGQFTLGFTDLEFELPGTRLAVSRIYDSRDKTKAEFGYGWRLQFTSIRSDENREAGDGWNVRSGGGFIPQFYLDPARPHTVSISLPGGRKQVFDVEASFEGPFNQTWGTISFRPRAGTYSRLESLDGVDFIHQGGILYDYDFEVFNPNRYRLTFFDGTYYIFDQPSGTILESGEPNGNRVFLTTAGLEHSAGASIRFNKDAQGRITSIVDGAGRTYQYAYDGHGNLQGVTDPEGNRTRFKYAPNHYLTDVISPNGVRGARTEYDESGRMMRQIDAQGNVVEFEHNPAARTETIRDLDGSVFTYAYDENGNVTSKRDSRGRTWRYEHDAFDNLLSTVDPLGSTWRSTWDARGNLLTQVDPLGNTVRMTYNSLNRLVEKTDALNRSFRFTYDSRGNLLTETGPGGVRRSLGYDARGSILFETNALGDTTRYEYNARGQLIGKIDPLVRAVRYVLDGQGDIIQETNARGLATTYTYDSKGRVLTKTDPDGHAVRYSYNSIGKPVEKIDKLGGITRYAYDVYGQMIRETGPGGAVIRKSYDPKGRVVQKVDEDGEVTRMAYDQDGLLLTTLHSDGALVQNQYDDAGRLIAMVDANGNLTRYVYDAAGRRVRAEDPMGGISTFEYDAVGRRTAYVDPEGRQMSLEYDANDCLVRTLFPDGSDRRMTCDALGRKIAETDQNGHTTRYAYDAVGNVTEVTDALGNRTRYTYDGNNNRLTQVDALGRTTAFAYDPLDRIAARTLPLGFREAFTYDANGNPVVKSDFQGEETRFTYDADNRLTRRAYGNGTFEAYQYTPAGKINSITNGAWTIGYAYDGRGRLMRKTDQNGRSIAYAYDRAGNRTSLTAPGGTTTFEFDRLNRLIRVSGPNGAGVTGYAYDRVGNRTAIAYPNGASAATAYDALNRVRSIHHRASDGVTISSFTYTLDASGNKVGVAEASGRTEAYAYDALDRLVREEISSPGLPPRVNTFAYDAVSNRVSSTGPAGTVAYSYDENDRLLTDGSATYAYDSNGNQVSATAGGIVTAYAYDQAGRLAAVTAPGKSLLYEYDPNGMKSKATVNGVVTEYLVDDNRDLAQVLEEFGGDGSQAAEYVYGAELLSMRRNGAVSYAHAGALGSTTELTGSDSRVTDRFRYEAYGNVMEREGGTDMDYLYAGTQADSALGLYYMRLRNYNAEQGRFVSMDPWQGDILAPVTLNKYLYGNGNPVNNKDPKGDMGIAGISITIAVIGILAGISYAIYRYYGKVRVEKMQYSTYTDATRGGLTIELGAKTKNRSPKFPEYRWVQFVTTNDPLGGMAAGVPYNDPQPPDDAKPFYWTDAELPGYQNRNGYDLIFYDQPKRLLATATAAFTVSWDADLALVGVDPAGSTSYSDIVKITYGFRITPAGVTKEDLSIGW